MVVDSSTSGSGGRSCPRERVSRVIAKTSPLVNTIDECFAPSSCSLISISPSLGSSVGEAPEFYNKESDGTASCHASAGTQRVQDDQQQHRIRQGLDPGLSMAPPRALSECKSRDSKRLKLSVDAKVLPSDTTDKRAPFQPFQQSGAKVTRSPHDSCGVTIFASASCQSVGEDSGMTEASSGQIVQDFESLEQALEPLEQPGTTPPPCTAPPASLKEGSGEGAAPSALKSDATPAVGPDSTGSGPESLQCGPELSGSGYTGQVKMLQFFVRAMGNGAGSGYSADQSTAARGSRANAKGGGGLVVVRAQPTDTVHSVLAQLQSKTGLPVREARLLFRGRQLAESATLASSGVANDVTLQLVGCLRSTLFPEVWTLVATMCDCARELASVDEEKEQRQQEEEEQGESHKAAGACVDQVQAGPPASRFPALSSSSAGGHFQEPSICNCAQTPSAGGRGGAPSSGVCNVEDGGHGMMAACEVNSWGEQCRPVCCDPEEKVEERAWRLREVRWKEGVAREARAKAWRERLLGALSRFLLRGIQLLQCKEVGQRDIRWRLQLSEYVEAFRLAGGPGCLVSLLLPPHNKTKETARLARTAIKSLLDPKTFTAVLSPYRRVGKEECELLDHVGPLLMELHAMLLQKQQRQGQQQQSEQHVQAQEQQFNSGRRQQDGSSSSHNSCRSTVTSSSPSSTPSFTSSSLCSSLCQKCWDALVSLLLRQMHCTEEDENAALHSAAFAVGPVTPSVSEEPLGKQHSHRYRAGTPMATGPEDLWDRVSICRSLCRSPDWIVRNLAPFVEKAAASLAFSLHTTSLLASGKAEEPPVPLSHCHRHLSLSPSLPLSFLAFALPLLQALPHCSSPEASLRPLWLRHLYSSLVLQTDTCLHECTQLGSRLALLQGAAGGGGGGGGGAGGAVTRPLPPLSTQSPWSSESGFWLAGSAPISTGDRSFSQSLQSHTATWHPQGSEALHPPGQGLPHEPANPLSPPRSQLPETVRAAMPHVLHVLHDIGQLLETLSLSGSSDSGQQSPGSGSLKEFLDMAGRHVEEMNALSSPTSLEGHGQMEWLLTQRHLLKPDLKQSWLLSKLPRPCEDQNRRFLVSVHRGPSLLHDSLEQIGCADVSCLKRGVRVRFFMEEGAGEGVVKEWLSLLGSSIFSAKSHGNAEDRDDEMLGDKRQMNGEHVDNSQSLFSSCPADRQRFFPSAILRPTPDHLSFYRTCGRVLALSLIHRAPVCSTLALPFFKLLAGRPVTWHDCADVDPQLHASCCAMVGMSAAEVDADVLGLTFSVCQFEEPNHEEGGSSGGGGGGKHARGEVGRKRRRVRTIELCPGGEGRQVTSRNMEEYLSLLVHKTVVEPMERQAKAFSLGISDLLVLPGRAGQAERAEQEEREVEALLDLNRWREQGATAGRRGRSAARSNGVRPDGGRFFGFDGGGPMDGRGGRNLRMGRRAGGGGGVGVGMQGGTQEEEEADEAEWLHSMLTHSVRAGAAGQGATAAAAAGGAAGGEGVGRAETAAGAGKDDVSVDQAVVLVRNLLLPLDNPDLDLLLFGEVRDVDVDDWKNHTRYHGYRAGDSQIRMFWDIVGGMTPDQRRRLLFFCTALTRLPRQGFSGLPDRFHIHRAASDISHLPAAHTCFQQLLLPPYPSFRLMRQKLLLILADHTIQGFGFA